MLDRMRKDAKAKGMLLEQSNGEGSYTIVDKVLISGIIIVGVIATAFSLAWGIMR